MDAPKIIEQTLSKSSLFKSEQRCVGCDYWSLLSVVHSFSENELVDGVEVFSTWFFAEQNMLGIMSKWHFYAHDNIEEHMMWMKLQKSLSVESDF